MVGFSYEICSAAAWLSFTLPGMSSVRYIDPRVLAQSAPAQTVVGEAPLVEFERLADLLWPETDSVAALTAPLPVRWQAQGTLRPVVGGVPQTWLRLTVQAAPTLRCERCLGPMTLDLSFERDYRFVAEEATAEIEDEVSEEDVLVWQRDFDLQALVEDELLMALPVVPKHDTCPVAVPFSVVDDDFIQSEAEKPNPFAALALLKRDAKKGNE